MMLTTMLVLAMLSMAVPASAVVGDLNRDGVVDLNDFFVFADNFGEAGQPDVSDCTVTGPLVDDGSVVPGLTALTFNSGLGPYNWDADAENEGFLITWDLIDTDLRVIYPPTKLRKPLSTNSRSAILATERRRRVSLEEYVDFLSPEQVDDIFLPVVAELQLTQADGSSFAASASYWTIPTHE